tara:strand:+ start:314 stop:439 length:126 start_codon:yes stop_codon:yes gene_type:complete
MFSFKINGVKQPIPVQEKPKPEPKQVPVKILKPIIMRLVKK